MTRIASSAFTTENTNGVEQQALPTFGAIIGRPTPDVLGMAGTFDPACSCTPASPLRCTVSQNCASRRDSELPTCQDARQVGGLGCASAATREEQAMGLPQYQNLIGGEMVDSGTGRWLESVNPATGEVWAEIPPSTATTPTGRSPRRRPHSRRGRRCLPTSAPTTCRRVAQIFAEHGDEIAALESTRQRQPPADEPVGQRRGR